MSARDPESRPAFYVPLGLVALLFAALCVVQWIDDYVADAEAHGEVAEVCR
jgi:hypothetical protein